MSKATEREKLKQMRLTRLVVRIAWYKAKLAERLHETRRLFGRKVLAVDPHVHSTYHDGKGTVDQNHASMKNAGLDFIFITDHGTIEQKTATRKRPGVSWGQEPLTKDSNGHHYMHHIGMLCGRCFTPVGDGTAADFRRAQKLAPFVWIPHPVGWNPDNWYVDEWIEALWALPDKFAMEVMNAAGEVVRSYDAFDRKSVAVWERLLCDGKKVTALGGSDAHGPEDIGSVWTGVFASGRTARAIIKALNRGQCFATEASLMDFCCGGYPMGSTVRKKKGSMLKLNFRVADSAGVASVRIVSQGKAVKTIQGKNQGLVHGSWCRKMPAKATYYRLESTASDDRRAFSTPIYVEPVL